DDFFVDVPYEGEIVRARARNGPLYLHEGGDSFVTLPAVASGFRKEQISPTRDTRLRWMQSVIHCTHYVTGAGEQVYLRPADAPRLRFHPVAINEYELFRFPDYTLPLSVRMAEVSRDHCLDVLHVHYAVPHATAAILARAMLPPGQQPRVVTTLHGTDTTLLGHDAGYAPAIKHALTSSDAVTAVSESLKRETQHVLDFDGPIEVIHNFFSTRPTPKASASVSSKPCASAARASPRASAVSRRWWRTTRAACSCRPATSPRSPGPWKP